MTPFILRESGLVVSDMPKIHIDDPSVEDHSIFDVETRLRIPLRISGILSVFQMRILNEEEIDNVEHYPSVLFSSYSKKWDPYDDSYYLNED